jgi:hypothetical protein
MTSLFSERRWVVAARRLFPWFRRDRHYAELNKSPPAAPQKMAPISRIVADAGRNSTTAAD